MNSVWIAIRGEEGYRVFEARKYQTDAYRQFMEKGKPAREDFHLCSEDGDIVFYLKPFDSTGFRGTYESFCVLVNENEDNHLLSDDETLLRGFIGYMNRVWYATC